MHLLAAQHKHRRIARAALVFTGVAESVGQAGNACTVFSEPADAPAGDTGGDNAKEEFPDIGGPRLDARFQNRCAFGFGVHVVRGTLDENAPSFSCGTVDINDLEGHPYSAPFIPVRRSSSVGLSCAVRNTMLPSCSCS